MVNPKLLCITLSIVLCSSVSSAGESQPIACCRASSPVVIDGKLDDEAWSKAGAVCFMLPKTDEKPLSTTEANVLWDDNYLYVAYRAYDDDVWSMHKDRDSQTYMEDCLECFIQPDATKQTYYNFEINAVGTIYDSYNISRNSGGSDRHRWAAWNCDGLRVGIDVIGTLNNWTDKDDFWQMELAIPFSQLPSLQGHAPKVGDIWKILLARYNYSVYLPCGVELSSCSHLNAVDFHAASDWSELRFVE